jgi:hypothetical protein
MLTDLGAAAFLAIREEKSTLHLLLRFLCIQIPPPPRIVRNNRVVFYADNVLVSYALFGLRFESTKAF